MLGDLDRLWLKRALVAGGTKGLGEALVAQLREMGARVLTTARSSTGRCNVCCRRHHDCRRVVEAHQTPYSCLVARDTRPQADVVPNRNQSREPRQRPVLSHRPTVPG